MRTCDFDEVVSNYGTVTIMGYRLEMPRIRVRRHRIPKDWRGFICVRCYQIVEHGFLMVHWDLIRPCGEAA